MAGISLNQKSATLRTDSLADLGVTIVDVELRCNVCGGASYMLPVPWETGNFPRNWYECPRGCNKGAAKKAA
ncbi:MAG: hypothetical protein WC978_00190 [bacterium]